MTPSEIYLLIKSGCSQEQGIKAIIDYACPEVSSNLERRESKFRTEVYGYLGTYPADMLSEFFDYWTEPNKSKTKMLFETKATWDLSRRLKRWAGNNFKSFSSNAPVTPSRKKQRPAL